MSLRLQCKGCGTAFLTTDDHLGRSVACPKCGAEQVVPATVAVEEPGASTTAGASAWVAPPELPPDDEPTTLGRRLRRALPIAIVLGTALVIGGVAAWLWPRRDPEHPAPPPEAARPVHPTEQVAAAYLKALVEGNTDAAGRLATVDEPPAIRSFGDPRLDPAGGRTVRGSFAPIAALHERVDKEFEYDPDLGRYKVRDPLGPAAETLDALHEAKAKAEQENIYAKMGSGDPEEALDAIESFLGSMATPLATQALTPQKLVPTYAQLVEGAEPPLPPEAEALASSFADDRETWDELLKRPFATLKADGPFIFEEASVLAPVRDALASSGDPPSTLRLTLTRFRLEGIDTGWRVTSARRVVPGDEDPLEVVEPSESSPTSQQQPGSSSGPGR